MLNYLETKEIYQRLLDLSSSTVTSSVSLTLRSDDNIWLIRSRINEEVKTAYNIKNKTNRKNVIQALTSVSTHLNRCSTIPSNGLCIYANDSESFCFSPFKPILESTYECWKRFILTPLAILFETHRKYGIITVDGNGFQIYLKQGNHISLVKKKEVRLLKQHGRGGQSALRLSRLADESRLIYIKQL